MLPVLNDVPQPQQPPEVPSGWQLGPPDFVGVGTMKSGTTWWWSILTSHPDIAVPPGMRLYLAKETHFFDRYGQVEDIDPASYFRYFPRPEGCIVGEWTPRYMYDFWTPPMLRATVPSAKLLVLLRDPLQRFVSGLGHHLRHGGALSGPVMEHQLHRSLYWQQLRNLLNHFGRDQILVLQYEQCIRQTRQQAARTFEFLGVDPDRWQPPSEFSRRVGFVCPKPQVEPATMHAVWQVTEPDISRLLADFPEIDRSLWPSVNQSGLRAGAMT